MTTRYAIVLFGAVPAEAVTPLGTVTTTAAHRGWGSPFAVANRLANTVSRDIAEPGTVTLPDCCEGVQLAMLSTAISGSPARRTRDRFASLMGSRDLPIDGIVPPVRSPPSHRRQHLGRYRKRVSAPEFRKRRSACSGCCHY